MNNIILRQKQVLLKTGLSKSCIYDRIANGEFPRPISLSGGGKGRAVGWLEVDIENWITEQIERSKARSLPVVEPVIHQVSPNRYIFPSIQTQM